MANDVFGRPLNPTSNNTPRNPAPLAPNPLEAGPQDEPFSGIRAPGDLGTSRASTSEFLGATYGVNATRPGLQEDNSGNWAPGRPGGHQIGVAVPYNPMPLDDRATTQDW
jgi:hypothetical protein